MTTLDGLVAALSQQGGWANVTTPSDITVDGYAGKEFQRTGRRRPLSRTRIAANRIAEGATKRCRQADSDSTSA